MNIEKGYIFKWLNISRCGFSESTCVIISMHVIINESNPYLTDIYIALALEHTLTKFSTDKISESVKSSEKVHNGNRNQQKYAAILKFYNQRNSQSTTDEDPVNLYSNDLDKEINLQQRDLQTEFLGLLLTRMSNHEPKCIIHTSYQRLQSGRKRQIYATRFGNFFSTRVI